MSRLRKPISIYSVARQLSPEEVANNKRKGELRKYLGIRLYLTDNSLVSYEDIVPSNYDSLDSYEKDKDYADLCICLNKPIPDHIVQKLVAARIELESLGVLI